MMLLKMVEGGKKRNTGRQGMLSYLCVSVQLSTAQAEGISKQTIQVSRCNHGHHV